jgi:hypothetical protein
VAEGWAWSDMSALRLYSSVAAAILVAGCGITYWILSHRKTPEQREAERRQRLSTLGRIIDGTVLDVREMTADGRGTLQLLIYNYDVGGVSYECAQDITYLHQSTELHRGKIGLPASVKYDPQNPSNSIVIAEGWSGLRG